MNGDDDFCEKASNRRNSNVSNLKTGHKRRSSSCSSENADSKRPLVSNNFPLAAYFIKKDAQPKNSPGSRNANKFPESSHNRLAGAKTLCTGIARAERSKKTTECTNTITAMRKLENDYPSTKCPICTVDLAIVSDTAIGQAAHVNACLDNKKGHVFKDSRERWTRDDAHNAPPQCCPVNASHNTEIANGQIDTANALHTGENKSLFHSHCSKDSGYGSKAHPTLEPSEQPGSRIDSQPFKQGDVSGINLIHFGKSEQIEISTRPWLSDVLLPSNMSKSPPASSGQAVRPRSALSALASASFSLLDADEDTASYGAKSEAQDRSCPLHLSASRCMTVQSPYTNEEDLQAHLQVYVPTSVQKNGFFRNNTLNSPTLNHVPHTGPQVPFIGEVNLSYGRLSPRCMYLGGRMEDSPAERMAVDGKNSGSLPLQVPYANSTLGIESQHLVHASCDLVSDSWPPAAQLPYGSVQTRIHPAPTTFPHPASAQLWSLESSMDNNKRPRHISGPQASMLQYAGGDVESFSEDYLIEASRQEGVFISPLKEPILVIKGTSGHLERECAAEPSKQQNYVCSTLTGPALHTTSACTVAVKAGGAAVQTHYYSDTYIANPHNQISSRFEGQGLITKSASAVVDITTSRVVPEEQLRPSTAEHANTHPRKPQPFTMSISTFSPDKMFSSKGPSVRRITSFFPSARASNRPTPVQHAAATHAPRLPAPSRPPPRVDPDALILTQPYEADSECQAVNPHASEMPSGRILGDRQGDREVGYPLQPDATMHGVNFLEVGSQHQVAPNWSSGLNNTAIGLPARQTPAVRQAGIEADTFHPDNRMPHADALVDSSRQQNGVLRPTELPNAAAIGNPGLPRCIPPWHSIPGTRLVVDMFRNRTSGVKGCPFWFLTHFHADHYMGLTKKSLKGTLVVNEVTGALVSAKLRIPADRMMILKMGTPYVIDGVTITLLDANHCPGAAMILAEPPGRLPVLHTGDCRLIPSMRTQPALASLVDRAILVLDTTYSDPEYSFPSQEEVLHAALTAVNAESFSSRTLLVFGTYTIGKERLFLEVALRLGRKVYVNKDKMKVLDCCALTSEYRELLTTNHLETNIHAVPLGKVNMQGLSTILDGYRGRYSTIIGFQPTGWTMSKQRGSATCGKRTQKGTVILYQLPYSEHSSFKELRDFVAWFKPRHIIPSVGNDGGPKARAIVQLLTQPAVEPPREGADIRTLFSNVAGGRGASATRGSGRGRGSARGNARGAPRGGRSGQGRGSTWRAEPAVAH